MNSKYKNLIFIVLILAMVLFYVFSGGSVGISLDYGEESLILSAADRDWLIPYDQIESLELAEHPNTGTLIDGVQKCTLHWGTWRNDLWGEYTLCIDPRIDSCIVITMKNGGIYVLNYENDGSTKQLHQMFSDLLQSKGFLTVGEKS